MNLPTIAALVLASMAFLGCTNIDAPKEKPNPNDIYFDYTAWGDEESGNITIKLQFRAGGPNQGAILLQPPSGVRLDNRILEADSTKFTGPYYELIIPGNEFTGQHSIVFTDNENNKYSNPFEFPIMRFKTDPPQVIGRNDLVLELEGLKDNDRVRVLLTDTSFYGRGVEKIDTIDNRPLVITRQELEDLKNGPVYMELFREEDKELEQTMKAGGRFYLSYELGRDLILRDSL